MPFEFRKFNIPDLLLIIPRLFPDDRGFFMESYKASEFKSHGIDLDFVQDNHSLSDKGVLRGLHYQKYPLQQGKLVRVIKGKVWDVAIDIRKNSPTFLQWIGLELSELNHHMFYIPPGFAHGFVTLEDNTHFLYKCTKEYSPEHETGIIYNDRTIGIQWPVEKPIVSKRDKQLPLFTDAYIFE